MNEEKIIKSQEMYIHNLEIKIAKLQLKKIEFELLLNQANEEMKDFKKILEEKDNGR